MLYMRGRRKCEELRRTLSFVVPWQRHIAGAHLCWNSETVTTLTLQLRFLRPRSALPPLHPPHPPSPSGASFTGNHISGEEANAVMRNMERKDGKIKYNHRMGYALMGGLGAMMIMVGAMFAVTFYANEATKESHVAGGALVGLDGESAKTSSVKSYGNILGFPCLPMDILETMDEVTMEVMVPKEQSSDGIMEIVMKVGVIKRFVKDKRVGAKSPSGQESLMVADGRATYTDDDVCKDGCTVLVSIDVATGRRLSFHNGAVDRSLTAEKPKLAAFATFNMLAKVFKQGCGAAKTIGAVCDAISNKEGLIESFCGSKAIKDIQVEQSIECGGGGTFTFLEIMDAPDARAAYDAISKRCGSAGPDPTGARPLKGGRGLKTNYGWCSMDLGFLMSKVGLRKIDDSADYCNAGHKEDDDGKGTGISGCCTNHDKCLTCDSAGRTCKGMNGAGGMHKLYGTRNELERRRLR